MSSTPSIPIEKKLAVACDDIRRTKKNRQGRLGILFAVPYMNYSSRDRMPELIDRWIQSINTIDCSCCAWVFPADARYARYRKNEKVFPGVALLIREV